MSQGTKIASIILTFLLTGCKQGSVFTPQNSDNQTEESKKEDAKGSSEEENPTEKVDVKELPLIQRAITDEDFMEFSKLKNPDKPLKEGEEQMAQVCANNAGKTNIVIQKFCVEKIRPKSLKEMQVALNLDPSNVTNRGNNGANGNPGFAVQGHSSSLVGQFVSSINPRVVIFNNQTPGGNANTTNFIAMGFVRGEQFAEILVANDNGASNPDLFLVAFKQACNAKPEGCSNGELLTPAVESNWTEFTLYQDEDLKNTIVDCRHCHQPEGVGTQVFGRMQELRNPWVHWMRDNRGNGTTLIDDYYAAHGQDETYGGIPGPAISGSDPANLEDLIRTNGFNQDQIPEIEFQTQTILDEVSNNNGAQPVDNTIPGQSATWEELYAQAAVGVSNDGRNIIPIPYHDVKVTEPSLLQKYTQQYQDFRAGMITVDQFEDHRDIFRTDHTQRANMGFAVREGTPPETMLIQACFQCHNGKLDTSISRANFSLGTPGQGNNATVGAPFQIDFAMMGANAAAEIDIAIERLKLGYTEERLKSEGIQFFNEEGEEVTLHKGEHMLTMPPRRFKSLTDQQIDTIIQFLESEKAKLQ